MLLSFRPDVYEKIKSGLKIFEHRRNFPDEPIMAYMYVSSPVKAITGIVYLDSGTGKTVLYEMLEDLRLTDEYRAIKLFNYKSDNLSESIEQCRDSFIVIDNADCLINDDVRRFINFELSNQYMLFLRNCDGLNVSDKSFKVLKFDNNRITLEEEL